MEQQEIQKIHQDVFDLLYAEHLKSPDDFFFTLRKINNNNRLDKGYWFYGNDFYLAVSFWTGFDYANKTPNISFIILFYDMSTRLEISLKDSEEKFVFFNEFLKPRFPAIQREDRTNYQKHYSISDPIESLRNFLRSDKKELDYIIKERGENFFGKLEPEHNIGFISESAFKKMLFKTIGKIEELHSFSFLTEQPPISLESLVVSNYGPIKQVSIKIEDPTAQFIFLTGENGGGKSSILRAITLGFTNDHHQQYNSLDDPELNTRNYEIKLGVRYGNKTIYNEANWNSGYQDFELIKPGFAAYGPHRLITTQSNLGPDSANRTDLTYSIFHDDGVLLDTWNNKFLTWEMENKRSKKTELITESIKTALHDLNDKLQLIIFPDDSRNKIGQTAYVEQDNSGEAFEQVGFTKLASGIRNIVAMFGDMMLRLYEQQSDVEDISDFKGLVIIDEIDLHLHPKLQRDIIEKLGGIFPKVQFVITTHSPIPLLGAPKNSLFFRVDRNVEEGVTVKEIDIEISNLLPNTILSSPIFGFHRLFPKTHDQKKKVRTEKTYEEVLENDELKANLKEIAERLKSEE